MLTNDQLWLFQLLVTTGMVFRRYQHVHDAGASSLLAKLHL